MILILLLANFIPSDSWPDGVIVSCSCRYKDAVYFCATKDLSKKTAAFYRFSEKSIEKISNSSVIPSCISCGGEWFIAGTDDGKIIIYDLAFKEMSVTKIYGCERITSVVAAEKSICYFTDNVKRVYRFDVGDRSCTVVPGWSAKSLKYNPFDSRMYLIGLNGVVCVGVEKNDEKYRFKIEEKISDVFFNGKNSNICISQFVPCKDQEFCIERIINPLVIEVDGAGKSCGRFMVDIPGEICALDINSLNLMCAISTKDKMFHFGVFEIKGNSFVSRDRKRENIVLTLGSDGFGGRHVMHGGGCAWLTNQSCWFDTNFAKRILHLDE